MTGPRRLEPPSGGLAPPQAATLRDGTVVALRVLAEEVCRRYHAEFPDDVVRYGESGTAWCVHDNQHILDWAVLAESHGTRVLHRQVQWLAGVLAARNFPLERLTRNLELAADVLEEAHPGAAPAAAALRAVPIVPGARRRRRGTAASRLGSSQRPA